jgi:hypothetical protein
MGWWVTVEMTALIEWMREHNRIAKSCGNVAKAD